MAGQPESVAVLFETALALQPSERKAFLDQECGHDTALRQIRRKSTGRGCTRR